MGLVSLVKNTTVLTAGQCVVAFEDN